MTVFDDDELNPKCSNCSNRFTNVFCKMKYDAMQGVEKEKVCTKYKKGETVFKEGSIPFGIYCLNKGKVKLSKTGDDGKEQIVRLYRPGDPFGYRSLFNEGRYNASAIAIEDSNVCFIPKDLFVGIIEKDINLAFEMLRLLSEDLKKAEAHLTNLAQKPVRERAAEALLFIHDTYGFEEDNITINAAFSREDIANIVGTATETIIRVLSDFNKEEVVMLKGKKILIIDMPQLIKIANAYS
ncbi:MAG TPA: Crp/Fnr family transcriptional regulator [Edaphocola sp.]|nr:Crp/Fnr family transcriptional regulator [Edaphocola sp.]